MGTRAFAYCTNLKEVKLPETVLRTCESNTSVNDETFRKTAITSINLKNVTRLGSYTFWACPNLTTIDLKNVQYFGSGTFQNTLKIKRIIAPNIISSSTSGFKGTNFAYGSRTLQLVDFGPQMVFLPKYIRYNQNSDYGYVINGGGWSAVTVVCRSNSFTMDRLSLQCIYRCYCTEEMYDYLKSSTNNNYTGCVYLIGGEQWIAQFGSSDPYANLTQEEYDYYYKDIVEQG